MNLRAILQPFSTTANCSSQLIYDEIVSKFELADDTPEIEQYFVEKLIPHKTEVYNAGVELMQANWFWVDPTTFRRNLIFHDLSKFSKIEQAYAYHNFSSNESSPAFARAWQHHKSINPHHPEHWLNPARNGELQPIDMEDIYVIEMIADWIGAGRTYGNEIETWLPDNLQLFKWSWGTAKTVRRILEQLNFDVKHYGNALFL